MSNITKEMEDWFHQNHPAVEFYILHRIINDPVFRNSAFKAIVFYDFKNEDYAALCAAMVEASFLCDAIGMDMPEPMTWEFLEPYMRTADNKESLFDDFDIGILPIRDLLHSLIDDVYRDMWGVVDVYFEIWMMDARSKRYARQALGNKVASAGDIIDSLERDKSAAQSVIYDEQVDDFNLFMTGESEERIDRYSTGWIGLDEALNGGYALGEAYLIFAGTGGGKCHAKGSILLDSLGYEIAVEDVKVGDRLLGPDGKARVVTELAR